MKQQMCLVQMPLFRKILLGICSNDAGKRKECDDIRECHQTVEDIRSIPNRFNREIRANENGCDIELSLIHI